MGFWARLKRDIRFVNALRRTLKRLKGVDGSSQTLTCDDLEAAVDKFAQRPAIEFEGRTITYAQLDAMANRYAHWATGRGIKRGDTVALFMPNRLEYIPAWYGLSKVGVATALINNNLTGAALCHCLKISGAAHLIADNETAAAFESVRADIGRSMMEWIVGGASAKADRDLDRTLKGVSSLRPTRETARYGVTAKDTVLYIYTSGTTGMPKAARIPHTRAQTYMRGFAAGTESKPEDKIYIPLPLYHATGGLCAVGAALLNGGQIVLKRKFSASQFWDDIARHGCTMFVYIGELCRYLVNQPEHEAERTPIKLAFGNGLRADVWDKMLRRFRIGHVLEFYGATEGNVSLLNFDGKPGAVGRIPKFLAKRFNVRLVRFDVETEEPLRSAQGLCLPCPVGEVGEAIGEIRADDPRANFTGYADKGATEKKILRDVFARGDAWFRTGDLMKQDGEGYFYFIDRVGDTFRWKGENVSTTEVAETIDIFPGVREAIVYGVAVPGHDGRAGMAALVVDDVAAFDLAGLRALLVERLPAYARPVFLRFRPELDVTGTFKPRKVELVAQGFDPARGGDPIFFDDRERGVYARVEPAFLAAVEVGAIKL